MDKLTIKHLAPYLPYGVRVDNGRDYEKDYLYGIRANCYNVKMAQGSRDSDYFRLENIKPILRPLSDLTKQDFNYIYTLLKVHIGKNKRDKLIKDGYGILDLPYFIIVQLLENHFDLFGLIEKELAIDIKTLK